MSKSRERMLYIFYAILGLFAVRILSLSGYCYSMTRTAYNSTASGFIPRLRESMSYSGYEIIELFGAGFWGVMAAITQLLFVIVLFSMMVWAIIGILNSFEVTRVNVSKLKVPYHSFAKYFYYILMGLSVLLFILMIFFTASNRVVEKFAATDAREGYKIIRGYLMGVGLFVSVLFYVGLYALYVSLKKSGKLEEFLTRLELFFGMNTAAKATGQAGSKKKKESEKDAIIIDDVEIIIEEDDNKTAGSKKKK